MQVTKEANDDVSKISLLLYSLIVIIALLPLLVTSVTGKLLEGAMHLAQVRIEQSVLYVKYPYSSLLPETLINSAATAQDFVAFKDVTILFQGIGSNTVIEFKEGEYFRQLRIPNDSVIVEKKSKKISSL